MTAFILRHKGLTVLFWVVLSLLGALSARSLTAHVDYTYTTPGQPGYVANQHILGRFRLDATFEPFLAVLHLPPGQGMDTAAGRRLAAHTFAAASAAGITAVADYANTGNPAFLLRHGQATWALINLPNPDQGPGAGIEARVDPAMQRAVPPGAKLTLTGFAQLLSGGASDPRTLAAGLLLGLLAAGLVLLPVLLSAWGPQLDALRLWPFSSTELTSATYSPQWAAWARLILRHRWLAIASSLAVLGALTWPAFFINTAEPLIGSLSGGGPAATAFQELRAGGVPSAVDFPIQVITTAATWPCGGPPPPSWGRPACTPCSRPIRRSSGEVRTRC